MKKLALALIACMAMTSFAQAATSALTESLLEYEAITSALGTNPNFENVISPTEFIVDIQRITRSINVLGEVKYEIVTRTPRSLTANATFEEEALENEASSSDSSSHHNRQRTHIYIAILNVQANPGIGPNIVTVVSIDPAPHNFRLFNNGAENTN